MTLTLCRTTQKKRRISLNSAIVCVKSAIVCGQCFALTVWTVPVSLAATQGIAANATHWPQNYAELTQTNAE